jgi:hypothetical protein
MAVTTATPPSGIIANHASLLVFLERNNPKTSKNQRDSRTPDKRQPYRFKVKRVAVNPENQREQCETTHHSTQKDYTLHYD